MYTITDKKHFTLQRKTVANMTSESWRNIPHVTYNYELDVTDALGILKEINFDRQNDEESMHITVNTLMLKVISEGLKAAPCMNAQIDYNKGLVRGCVKTIKEINISMPMVMPSGEMMTVNVRGAEKMNLDNIAEKVEDIRRRSENTIPDEALYETALYNTFLELRKGHILKVLGRLIGSKTGKHKLKALKGEDRRRYYSMRHSERLTSIDLEPGTVTVSNIGSVAKGLNGNVSLLEIIPPQVTAVGIGTIQEKCVPIKGEKGSTIGIRQMLPVCVAFDHRALDFCDIVPFLTACRDIFASPLIIKSWLQK